LKKRSKKLLQIAASLRVAALSDKPDAMCKSFLVLFFKKEHPGPRSGQALRTLQ
jgi:hypothetical protein